MPTVGRSPQGDEKWEKGSFIPELRYSEEDRRVKIVIVDPDQVSDALCIRVKPSPIVFFDDAIQNL